MQPSQKPTSEADALMAELLELDKQGPVDEAKLAELDKRFDQMMARRQQAFERELSAKMEAFDRARAQAMQPKLPKPIRVTLAITFLLLATGAILEISLGKYFVFAYADTYRAHLGWPYALITVLMWLILSLGDQTHAIVDRSTYPTKWVRNGIVLPVMSLCAAGILVVGPLGCLALLGWASQNPPQPITAMVNSIEVKTHNDPTRGTIRANVTLENNTADVCLDNRYIGRTPVAGDTVALLGRQSIWGTYLVKQVQLTY